jgi:hypothetical protein
MCFCKNSTGKKASLTCLNDVRKRNYKKYKGYVYEILSIDYSAKPNTSLTICDIDGGDEI